jgi:hypothetical protein
MRGLRQVGGPFPEQADGCQIGMAHHRSIWIIWTASLGMAGGRKQGQWALQTNPEGDYWYVARRNMRKSAVEGN